MQPDSGNGEASPAELVQLFTEEATRRLTSLPVTPRLTCVASVLRLGDTGWEQSDASNVTGWFDVTVTFTSAAIEGAFRFGEREHAVWAVARRAGAADSFALSEWARALGRPTSPLEVAEWVFHPERLRTIVEAFSDGLRDLHDDIAGAPESLVAGLHADRAARADDDAERARLRQQERDEVQAGAAFRRGDFGSVAKLLRAHLQHLSAAQRQKLSIAESKLQRSTP